MTTHPFLSDNWIEAARGIRESKRDQMAGGGIKAIKVNFTVTDVPAEAREDQANIDGHFDTSAGEPEIELGHVEDPDVAITGPYDLMRSILVEGKVNKALEGMQLGRLKVNGNMFKLMGLAKLKSDPQVEALLDDIQAITA